MSAELLTADVSNLYQIGFFALAALIIKVGILRFANTRTTIGRSLFALCVFLVAQNTAEFLGYMTYAHDQEMTFRIVDGYMIATYFVFACIVIFAFDLVTEKRGSILHWVMPGLATFLSALHIGGYLVDDYHFNGYSLVRNPAEYYRLVEIYVSLCALIGLIMPAGFYITGRNRERQLLIALLGLSVYCVGAIFLVVSMANGFDFSSAIIGPIASTFFLVVILCSSEHEHFLRIESELIARVKIIKLIALDFGKKDLADHKNIIEEILTELALSRCAGNKIEAAKMLGVSRSTINRKCKKRELMEDQQ